MNARLHIARLDTAGFATRTDETIVAPIGDDVVMVGDRIARKGRTFTVVAREWDEDGCLHLHVTERAS